MSIQRCLLIALVASGLGAASALAQNAPLNIDRAARVNARAAATTQDIQRSYDIQRQSTYADEPFGSGQNNTGAQNFFEFLFGGFRPPQPLAPPPFLNEASIGPDRYTAYGDQQDAEGNTERRPVDPKFLPQAVTYNGAEKPGTIVIDTRSRFLYLVQENGQAMRYGIGVGRPGFTWAGIKQVSSKREWPDWIPPDDMLRRRPDLPHFMAGGPDNPLGARAIYLGSSLYRIHGSNEPWTIGQAVSSGCIRMRNEDVIELYQRVKVGTKVIVI